MTIGFSSIEVAVDLDKSSFSELMEMNACLEWVSKIMGERNWRQQLFQGVSRGKEKCNVAAEESGSRKDLFFRWEK